MGPADPHVGDAPAGSQEPRVKRAGTRPEAIKAVPIRHWGRWIASVVILYIFVALIYSLAKNTNLQWDVVGHWMFKPLVLRGVAPHDRAHRSSPWSSGMVGGTLLAVMRLSKNYVLSGLSWLYIWFFRGTPGLRADPHLGQLRHPLSEALPRAAVHRSRVRFGRTRTRSSAASSPPSSLWA